MSCAAGLASHLAHYFGATDFEDRGQSAPEFWPLIEAYWTRSCASWSCWIIQRNAEADLAALQKLSPRLAKELAEVIKTGKEEDRFYGLASKISG